MKTLPALSIRQPWAWLIVNGIKPVENREWTTRFRGRILVHAGKTMTKEEYLSARATWREAGGSALELPPPEFLDRGGIVGSVDIVDVVESHPSPYFVGQYGFVLARPSVLPFVPYPGKLGFFNVPATAVAA